MKKFLECLLFGLILIIVFSIYQGAKSDGKIIGKKLKLENRTL